ncbi:MAG: hypothetical protein M0R47_17125 [Methylobacter sp.]|jgi:Skp family chaperone for outer membrane proteins|uniref:hypothetical protein n=1 Tax=Methylobacter sp. TaxID=2051955 RepID=UPI0025D986AB|nr:hypothetical protein [Methylobacter sp.]MCK9622247.1 hypothetical protein [Methylobacter sp.]
MKSITIMAVCVAILGGCSAEQSKKSISAQVDPQRTSGCRIAHLDKRKVLQAEDRKKELENQNFLILTNDEANFVSKELDLTNSIVSDNYRISNNTQNQLNNIRAKQCKVALINYTRILENYHQAKASKKQLEKEFLEWDKHLVELKSNASSEIFEVEQKRFSDAFNIRRNEELAKLEKTFTDEVKDFSQRNKVDLIVTGFTENYEEVAHEVKFSDVTEEFRKFTETLGEDTKQGSN